jgi:hypothetical protein
MFLVVSNNVLACHNSIVTVAAAVSADAAAFFDALQNLQSLHLEETTALKDTIKSQAHALKDQAAKRVDSDAELHTLRSSNKVGT